MIYFKYQLILHFNTLLYIFICFEINLKFTKFKIEINQNILVLFSNSHINHNNYESNAIKLLLMIQSNLKLKKNYPFHFSSALINTKYKISVIKIISLKIQLDYTLTTNS